MAGFGAGDLNCFERLLFCLKVARAAYMSLLSITFDNQGSVDALPEFSKRSIITRSREVYNITYGQNETVRWNHVPGNG